MHIQRIHDGHPPLTFPEGPHTTRRDVVSTGSGGLSHSEVQAGDTVLPVSRTELQSLVHRLHQLPDRREDAIQQARAQIESGELFTREAARLVAFSPLHEFVF